jgi:hypothetical protein
VLLKCTTVPLKLNLHCKCACETNKNTTTTTRKTVQEAARGVEIKTAILLKCNVVPIELNFQAEKGPGSLNALKKQGTVNNKVYLCHLRQDVKS